MADKRNWLIDHTGIGVSDIHRSNTFYEAALRPLGIRVVRRITRDFKPANADAPDLGGVACSGFGRGSIWCRLSHILDRCFSSSSRQTTYCVSWLKPAAGLCLS